MKRLLFGLTLLALALSASAAAGGWATVQLSSLPGGTKAGGTWTPELTVLQHGRTPLDGVIPVITITAGDGTAKTFTATPTGTPGKYRAEVTFPSGGSWRYQIWDGFSRTHTFAPLTIASPDGGGFPRVPVGGAAVAALGIAALALLARRRRTAPQPALDA
jgi:YtkA-like protein